MGAVVLNQEISKSNYVVNLQHVKTIDYSSTLKENSFGGHISFNYLDNKVTTTVRYGLVGDETPEQAEERFNGDVEQITNALALGSEHTDVINIIPPEPEPESEEPEESEETEETE